MAGAFGQISWRKARLRVDQPMELGRSRPSAQARAPALHSYAVYVMVAVYAVVFAALSILQHQSFQTNAFDLGNMDQAVWNTAHGRPLEFTNWPGGTNRLAAHVEPVLLLVALAYSVYSSPLTLLVLQSAIVALGALPAYWLARDIFGGGKVAAVFALSNLLSPALEIANLADFHPVAFSSSFLLFAFYYLHRRSYLPFALFAVLAMATKEQVPLTVFAMGLYIAFGQKARGAGYMTCAVSAIWAFVAFAIVIPHFNAAAGVSPYVSRYDQLGAGPLQIITAPARLEYLQSLFQPLFFLPLLSPLTLALALPELGINLMSNFEQMYSGGAHYGAVLVPLITVSAILGAGTLHSLVAPLHPRAGRSVRWVLGGSIMVASLTGFTAQVLLPLSDHPPFPNEHDHRAEEVLRLVPATAAVSASSGLNPHLSQRQQLTLFPELGNATYVAIDVTATPYPVDAANQWYRLQQLLDSGGWGVRAVSDGVLLLQQSAVEREPPERFYSFMQGHEGDIAQRLDVPFGEDLVLEGYSLQPGAIVHGPRGYANLDLYWRVLRPPAYDFLVAASVVSDGTSFVDRHQPATLWRPPTEWREGDLVRVHVPYLPVTQQSELRVSLVEREAPYATIENLHPAGNDRVRDGGASFMIAGVGRGL
jgi:uncharacterized membrane protein